MSELINRWFGRLHRVNGVVAYGLRHADGSTFSRTWDAQFAELELDQLWRRLADIATAALPEGESASSMRWDFHNHVASAVPRQDGATFFVLFTSKADQFDSAGFDRVASEFRGLRL
jgi:hypothetical protein